MILCHTLYQRTSTAVKVVGCVGGEDGLVGGGGVGQERLQQAAVPLVPELNHVCRL